MEKGKEEILRVRIISPPAEPEHVRFPPVNRLLISAPFKLVYLYLHPCLPNIGLNKLRHVHHLLVSGDIEVYGSTGKSLLVDNILRLLRVILIKIGGLPF